MSYLLAEDIQFFADKSPVRLYLRHPCISTTDPNDAKEFATAAGARLYRKKNGVGTNFKAVKKPKPKMEN